MLMHVLMLALTNVRIHVYKFICTCSASWPIYKLLQIVTSIELPIYIIYSQLYILNRPDVVYWVISYNGRLATRYLHLIQLAMNWVRLHLGQELDVWKHRIRLCGLLRTEGSAEVFRHTVDQRYMLQQSDAINH